MSTPEQHGKSTITVVSGLPRSGTSLIMQMLSVGGADLLVDGQRKADPDNPRGYFEYERVKHLDKDTAFLKEGVGKVVKVVSLLLYRLPANYFYRVIFMRRDLKEILASQKIMLARAGEPKSEISDGIMLDKLETHVTKLILWLNDRDNMRTLFISHRDVLQDPLGQAIEIDRYCGGGLNVQAMAAAVDVNLYRQRSPGQTRQQP